MIINFCRLFVRLGQCIFSPQCKHALEWHHLLKWEVTLTGATAKTQNHCLTGMIIGHSNQSQIGYTSFERRTVGCIKQIRQTRLSSWIIDHTDAHLICVSTSDAVANHGTTNPRNGSCFKDLIGTFGKVGLSTRKHFEQSAKAICTAFINDECDDCQSTWIMELNMCRYQIESIDLSCGFDFLKFQNHINVQGVPSASP